jgi:hypothetical protein
MGPISRLQPLENAALPQGAPTAFNDFKITWTYAGGKFDASSFILYSDPFWAEGKGTLSLDGALNGRLEVYLSNLLTQKVLESWGHKGKAEDQRIGPFPFLLVGNFSSPGVQEDERQMENFLSDVKARRFRRILADPFKKA